MCGIFAFYNPLKQPQLSSKAKPRALESIAYRGRDGNGFWSDEFIALGHTRLAIIDLDTGDQPMFDHTGHFVIVFNGEIYNYLELREEYEKLGAQFRTHSDTEVILEGYKLKGSSVVKDLNGMFAFILWDRHNKKAFIARDRLGKKPLFWCKISNQYIFSSTIKTLEPYIEKNINFDYIEQVKAFGSVIDESSIWQLVYTFPPASMGILEQGRDLRTEQYWNISFTDGGHKSLEEYTEEYEAILEDAIRIRLRSDVPLCLTFSGGVDSGTIAGVISKKFNKNVNLFCIDYDTEKERSPEIQQARTVAQILGLPLKFINYDFKNQMLKDFQEEYTNFAQPCIQFPLVYSGVLYKNIRQFATVTLSGNGADEIFTGYQGDEENYYKNQIYRCLRPLFGIFPMPGIPNVLKEGVIKNYITRIAGYLTPVLQQILQSELEKVNVNDYYKLQMYMSLKYGARDSNFVLPDVTGLTHQVEVRSPFLDHRMVEFGARLPLKYKVNRSKTGKFITKYLMKKHYAKYVPDNIAFALKKGMGYNFTWQNEVVSNKKFFNYFKSSIQTLSAFEIKAETFLVSLESYLNQMKTNEVNATNSSHMMFGFLLGSWLKQNFGK